MKSYAVIRAVVHCRRGDMANVILLDVVLCVVRISERRAQASIPMTPKLTVFTFDV